MHKHEGRSQREIARILGISRNTVKKYFEVTQVRWERQGVSGRLFSDMAYLLEQ